MIDKVSLDAVLARAAPVRSALLNAVEGLDAAAFLDPGGETPVQRILRSMGRSIATIHAAASAPAHASQLARSLLEAAPVREMLAALAQVRAEADGADTREPIL